MWALAKLDYYDPQLMDAVASLVAPKLSQHITQHLSNLAWGYAKLSHLNVQLFESLAEESVAKAPQLTLQHLCNILCAFATFDVAPNGILNVLIPIIKDRARTQVSGRSSQLLQPDIMVK